MSIPVDLSDLSQALARYRFAYLMTSSTQGAPHVVTVRPLLQGTELVIEGSGRRTRANALERPSVGLVWPPEKEDEYSLIVDGEARLVGEQLRIQPVRAVLHRPAPAAKAEAACGSDCMELSLKPCAGAD
ncbi:pyridoxamine 5'-phosphate oxidase family protein [Ottowia thiooxydans]|uniref:pyridoxamine 5'-phosphate oxidase family protein n=1 Tax=Ottowia thiooxydans TaxID=219182 RepID=UPI00041E75AF|nr:pyridoxamine 5'-phosphate oxidase family protein [Ottowia thiooxydans]